MADTTREHILESIIVDLCDGDLIKSFERLEMEADR